MNCQHCQALLLDHLYGLLDSSEAAGIDAHLAGCPACTAAGAEVARVQGLIAKAAKSAFPDTKFVPPVAQPQKGGAHTPAPGTPAVLPFPAPADRKSRGHSHRIAAVIPWAVAAAVLLAIPGTVVPVLNIFNRAESVAREAEVARLDAESAARAAAAAMSLRERSLADSQFKLAAAENAQVAILDRWVSEQNEAVEKATARRFSVDVLKPATVQPGAPNDFVVVVNDRRQPWETVGKRMVAEVHAVDASDAVIFTQAIETERTGERTHPLRLPASAWTKVKPEAELYLVVAQVDEKTQARTELQARVRLAGPVFTTLLVTDKASYRPGERLFFRSLTLDRVTLRPPEREQILKYELLSPEHEPVGGVNVTGTTELVRVGAAGAVEPVRAADGRPVRGVGCGEFVLPPELPDGDYTLQLTELQHPGGFPATLALPVTRPVSIRSGAADAFRKRIAFEKESFAPGDTVSAWAELTFEDKPVAGAAVAGVTAVIDGQPVQGAEVSKQTDALGRAKVRFPLPSEILAGDVRLKVAFRTPRGEEAVARRVPVVGNRVVVEFFPESGAAAVAGVPCKVYVRATTPAGQPVSFRGVVTDGRREIAKVESFSDADQPGANRGLASFTYTPDLNTRAWLKLESPASVYAPLMTDAPVPVAAVAAVGGPGAVAARTGFPLPDAKPDGIVMSVLDPVTAPGEPIRVKLYSVGRGRQLVVGAYTRGKLSDTQRIFVDPEKPEILTLMAGTDPRGGVVRITAFHEADDHPDLLPVAERLVFRKPGEVLNLSFSANQSEARDSAPAAGYPPQAKPVTTTLPAGAAVDLALTATDEKGNPAAAILWAAAVNSGVAPGERDRLLPTHFLLAGEVKNPEELEYADFLLTDHKKAGEALDLLLGTQGWRRFAEQTPTPVRGGKVRFAPPPSPEMVRLMLQNGQNATRTDPLPIREHRELYQKYAPLYEAAGKAVAKARARLEAAREEPAEPDAASRAAAESATRVAADQAARVEAAREPVRQFRANVWFGVAGLGALALCCGLASLIRPAGRLPLGFSTLGAAGLAAFLAVAAGWGADARATEAAVMKPPAAEEKVLTAPAPHEAVAPEPAAPTLATEPQGGFAGPGAEVAKGAATPGTPAVAGGGPRFFGKAEADGVKETATLPGYPPPVFFPNAGRHGYLPKLGAPAYGMGGFGGATGARPPVVAAPAPVAPVAPGVPAPAPAPGGTGWKPNRADGVTVAELAADRQLAPAQTRMMMSRDRGVTEHADALRKAADRAQRYAADRNAALAAPFENYFEQGKGAKDEKPEAAFQNAIKAYVVQKVRGAVNAPPPLVVREFAAPRPSLDPLACDADAPDTVLWQPVIAVPGEGKVTLHFHLGAAPGGYEVVVAGHAGGRLGAVRGLIRVEPPKTLAPRGQVAPGGAIPPPIPVAPPPPPMP